MCLTFDPRRTPYRVGEGVLSFPALHKEFRWPDSVAEPLVQCVEGGRSLDSLPDPLLALLRTQGVVGTSVSSRLGGPVPKQAFVLDELSLAALEGLPQSGPFLYTGDPRGGFYAPSSGQGSVPCPHCLMRRFLSSRGGTPSLYQALEQGHTVRFETAEWGHFQDETGVLIFGADPRAIDEVLPVPGCPNCWSGSRTYSEKALDTGLFSPLVRRWQDGNVHTVALPQMLWLVGSETVGSGSAWAEEPALAELKATHEALERYAAHFHPDSLEYQNRSGERALYPEFPSLLTQAGSVSTGLACRRVLDDAVEDGLREVCERDALARFWLAADAGEPSAQLLGKTNLGELEVTTFLLDSHHLPTVVAQGRTAQGRMVFGSACQVLERAIEKATQECRHNFENLSELDAPEAVPEPSSFYEHALTYWCHPEQFPELLPKQVGAARPLAETPWWLELTPADLECLGYRVVRVHLPGFLHTPMRHKDWGQILEGTAQPPRRPHPFA